MAQQMEDTILRAVDASALTDEALLAWVATLGGSIRFQGQGYGFDWADGVDGGIQRQYSPSQRACALDYLAFKGIINGPTQGRFDRRL
jgi:hypothetical protein